MEKKKYHKTRHVSSLGDNANIAEFMQDEYGDLFDNLNHQRYHKNLNRNMQVHCNNLLPKTHISTQEKLKKCKKKIKYY